MNIIVEKNTNSTLKNYLLIGAAKNTSNFGSNEYISFIVCDSNGDVKILDNNTSSLRIVDIDGCTPKEVLSKK